MEGLILDASKKRMNDPNWEPPKQEEPKIDEARVRKGAEAIKFPAYKIAQLEELYSSCAVRDFGDDYHESEKEREAKSDIYKIYKKIRTHRTKYNKLVQYIEIMRDCYDFVLSMAKRNRMIMDPEEFVTRVYRREIDINGFEFPKYSGRDRKDINWKEVRKYVVDKSLDPHDFTKSKEINYLPPDVESNPEEHLGDYFNENQIKEIFENDSMKRSTTLVYDGENDSGVYEIPTKRVSKKQRNALFKMCPEFIRPLKDAINSGKIQDSVKSYAYELDADAYEYITKMDKKRGFLASDRFPEFKGDIMKSDDYKRYLYQLDEFNEQYGREYVNGRSMTVAEVRDNKLKQALSEAGWNVMELYGNKEKIKEDKKKEKRDKQKEKRLRKKLTRLENRREAREGNVVNSKKDKGKKKNKGKRKALDRALLYGTGEDNFDDYEERMLDMSYGYHGDTED